MLLTKAETKPIPSSLWRLAPLVGAGLATQALLVVLVVLYVNVPPGHDVPYGLNLPSIDLFRALWAYPVASMQPGVFSAVAATSIFGTWVLYLLASAIVERSPLTIARRQIVYVVVAFAVLYNATLVLFMPPVLSSDIYHYALFGRMVAFHGLNPCVVSGTAISSDPLYALAFWRDVTTHYGPVWTLMSAGMAVVGGNSTLFTILVFKAVPALFNLANCLLVFLLARRLTGGDGLRGLLLYAWNPLILIETAGSGHNDAVMVTFALLGLLAAVRRRLLVGLAALLLSVMVKYLTAILLLFYAVSCLVKEESWRRVVALTARMGAVAVILVGVFYLPFWDGPQSLTRLVEVGSPFKSPVRVLLRNGVESLLASGGAANAHALAETYVIWGLNAAFALLLVIAAVALIRSRVGWPRLIELWGVASLVYVVVVYGWIFPWYLIPALTASFIGGSTRMNNLLAATSTGLGIGLMLFYTVLVRV